MTNQSRLRPQGGNWRPIRIARLTRAKQDPTPVETVIHEVGGKGTAKGLCFAVEPEPSVQEIANEEALIREENKPAPSPNRKLPDPGKDLLASYMEEISQIPLFTPEQESDNAKRLEAFELTTWALILELPRAVQDLESECAHAEVVPSLLKKISELGAHQRKAAGRCRAKQLLAHARREQLAMQIARELRATDFDKEILERVTKRLRREVWGRRVLAGRACFRVTHNELTTIERARGEALRARNDFVRANLRLVVSVARNFHHSRIPFIDLIQEGNVGLMKAVHRFDHTRGFRFSTYAHWWIRQSIERAISNKGNQVRLPVHVIDSRRQVGRTNARLTQKLGRTPTSAEISRSLRISTAKVEQVLNGVQQDPVSLDESLSGDDPRRLLDLVRDESIPALDESVIRENTHSRVRELMALLNPIEKDIIRRRFGIGDDSDQTLDEIGRAYDLSRERVRQIQTQGLEKMRRMCERRQIG